MIHYINEIEESTLKFKITVLKRTFHEDLAQKYCPPDKFGLCQVFKEGEEYISEHFLQMPQGFCGWAWGDIHKILITFVLSSL